MARLLLVEDDPSMHAIIASWLMREEHEVDIAETGRDAIEKLTKQEYDLLILDWVLPDSSGIDICKAFRSIGGTTPILMLTAKSGLENKGLGFDAGVDDYLTKPFEMPELSMRVKALVRRAAATARAPQKSEVDDASGPIQIGQVIDGKYRLDEFIAQGGMADLYRATHIGMGKRVVLKMVQGHLLKDESTLKRFEMESKAMARISHANVAAVFDTGLLHGEQPYLVMEYIHGESLYELLDREGALPIATAVKILIQVCRGLEEAHDANIIHRDLKPGNILLQDSSNRPDWVKIVDFGIAHLIDSKTRLTTVGSIVGTAEYLAPEQLRDFPVDCRVDLYALGIILYQMLTGDVPFEASTTEALLLKQLHERPAPVGLWRKEVAAGSPIEKIVDKALEKEPDRRYQTASEMRLALEQALATIEPG